MSRRVRLFLIGVGALIAAVVLGSLDAPGTDSGPLAKAARSVMMLGLTFAVAMAFAGLAHRLVGSVAAFAIAGHLFVPAWCGARITGTGGTELFFRCQTYLGMSFPGFPRTEELSVIAYVPAALAGFVAAIVVYLIARRASGTGCTLRLAALVADI